LQKKVLFRDPPPLVLFFLILASHAFVYVILGMPRSPFPLKQRAIFADSVYLDITRQSAPDPPHLPSLPRA
jgi:hypothetical protein